VYTIIHGSLFVQQYFPHLSLAFDSVLGASYTFPSHRLNNVPIALYFATHFYFVTYHTFSNMILRKVSLDIETWRVDSLLRFVCCSRSSRDMLTGLFALSSSGWLCSHFLNSQVTHPSMKSLCDFHDMKVSIVYVLSEIIKSKIRIF